MKNSRFKKLLKYRYIVYFLCLIAIYFIYDNYITPNQIDFCVHVYNNGVSTGERGVFDLYSYNLFQLLLYLFYRIIKIPLKTSGIIILVFFEGIRLFFIDCVVSKHRKDWFLPILNCSLLFIMGIIGVSGVIYMGKGAGNIWHNTTYSALVPFSIMTLYYFKKIYIDETMSKKNLILLSIFMFISIVAKPSFMIAFLPSCFVYLVFEAIKNRDLLAFKNKILTGILVSLPCLIYLLLEYVFTYKLGNSNSSIIIAPFAVWSISSNNIVKSFVLGIAFSLCYFILNKKWKSKDFIFMAIMLVFGFSIFALFAESGPRFADGNFGWTYNICGLMFQTYCVIDLYINKNIFKNKFIYYFCYFVYSMHFISGLIYVYQIVNHLAPYYNI